MKENQMEVATLLEQQGDWSSLPVDVLVQILARLRWSSHPSFGLACRQWQSARAYSTFYPVWITPLLLNVADVGTTNLRYYSPFYNKNLEIACTLNTRGTRICCATGHRLTLCTKHKIITAELLTSDVVGGELLPPINVTSFDFVVYDRVRSIVFGISTSFGLMRIARCIRNETTAEWQDWEYTRYDPVGTRFSASPGCNPVLHNSLLYLLEKEGGLAVYDESMHDEGFEILEKPVSFGFECYCSYLVESDQHELMAVLVGRRGTQVTVVKLNESTMEWEKIESLEGRSLFTGTLTTTMKKTNIKWMQNKIFLPRFHNWPETVHAHLVHRDGELAFVPNSMHADTKTKGSNYVADMWTYELGQGEEASEFWGTEKADYSIWVDFSSN